MAGLMIQLAIIGGVVIMMITGVCGYSSRIPSAADIENVKIISSKPLRAVIASQSHPAGHRARLKRAPYIGVIAGTMIPSGLN